MYGLSRKGAANRAVWILAVWIGSLWDGDSRDVKAALDHGSSCPCSFFTTIGKSGRGRHIQRRRGVAQRALTHGSRATVGLVASTSASVYFLSASSGHLGGPNMGAGLPSRRSHSDLLPKSVPLP